MTELLFYQVQLKNDELGFWTIEKEIVENLNYEFNEMWSKAIDLKTND